jgi:hypothetical protein
MEHAGRGHARFAFPGPIKWVELTCLDHGAA